MSILDEFSQHSCIAERKLAKTVCTIGSLCFKTPIEALGIVLPRLGTASASYVLHGFKPEELSSHVLLPWITRFFGLLHLANGDLFCTLLKSTYHADPSNFGLLCNLLPALNVEVVLAHGLVSLKDPSLARHDGLAALGHDFAKNFDCVLRFVEQELAKLYPDSLVIASLSYGASLLSSLCSAADTGAADCFVSKLLNAIAHLLSLDFACFYFQPIIECIARINGLKLSKRTVLKMIDMCLEIESRGASCASVLPPLIQSQPSVLPGELLPAIFSNAVPANTDSTIPLIGFYSELCALTSDKSQLRSITRKVVLQKSATDPAFRIQALSELCKTNQASALLCFTAFSLDVDVQSFDMAALLEPPLATTTAASHFKKTDPQTRVFLKAGDDTTADACLLDVISYVYETFLTDSASTFEKDSCLFSLQRLWRLFSSTLAANAALPFEQVVFFSSLDRLRFNHFSCTSLDILFQKSCWLLRTFSELLACCPVRLGPMFQCCSSLLETSRDFLTKSLKGLVLLILLKGTEDERARLLGCLTSSIKNAFGQGVDSFIAMSKELMSILNIFSPSYMAQVRGDCRKLFVSRAHGIFQQLPLDLVLHACFFSDDPEAFIFIHDNFLFRSSRGYKHDFICKCQSKLLSLSFRDEAVGLNALISLVEVNQQLLTFSSSSIFNFSKNCFDKIVETASLHGCGAVPEAGCLYGDSYSLDAAFYLEFLYRHLLENQGQHTIIEEAGHLSACLKKWDLRVHLSSSFTRLADTSADSTSIGHINRVINALELLPDAVRENFALVLPSSSNPYGPLANPRLFESNILRNITNATYLHKYLLTGIYGTEPVPALVKFAKLLASSGLVMEAVEVLKNISCSRTADTAKVSLLLARTMAESSLFDVSEIRQQFKMALDVDKLSAKSNLRFALFEDRLYQQKESNYSPALVLLIIKSFVRTLVFSDKHDLLVIPRLITIWLDFTSQAIDSETRDKAHKFIRHAIKQVKTLKFLPHSTQMISRLCHQEASALAILQQLSLLLLQAYPHHVLWKIIPLQMSVDQLQRTRANTLFESFSYKSLENAETARAYSYFAECIIGICNAKVDKKAVHIALPRQTKSFKSVACDRVMLPASKTLWLLENSIFIRDVSDEIEVLSSLQRPKKIRLLGSDGHPYTFLCKPNDDLRKDSRFMEFCNLLNNILWKNAGCAESGVKTFCVCPVNETCGIIEWVENTKSFRQILTELYQDIGVKISLSEVKEILDSSSQRVSTFRNSVLPKFPAVFYRWLLLLPDSSSWLSRRRNLIDSVAKMSIIGFILGLGDRHCENILFDSSTGECVHVDFNCLFEKGKSFEIPELVPFRLTQNLADSFGPSKWSGRFERAAEQLMLSLQKQRLVLVTSLESFVHDPLLEWKIKADASGLVRAKGILEAIQKKLSGHADSETPLNFRGQISRLIHLATDDGLLSQMYIGWAAFL